MKDACTASALRLSACAALLALAACVTGGGGPLDPMQIYFRNTVLVTQPYGEVDRILLSPDHTYVMYGIRYPEGHGRWSVEDNRVCLMPNDAPDTQEQKFCNHWRGRAVGDQWVMTMAGNDVSMEITHGRLGPIPTAVLTTSPPPH